jgi:hypothetical protein
MTLDDHSCEKTADKNCLKKGDKFEMKVFFAERMAKASNFMVQTSIDLLSKYKCKLACEDGNVPKEPAMDGIVVCDGVETVAEKPFGCVPERRRKAV